MLRSIYALCMHFDKLPKTKKPQHTVLTVCCDSKYWWRRRESNRKTIYRITLSKHLQKLPKKTFTPEPAGVACLAETFLLVWSTEWAVFLNHSSDTLQSDCDTFIGAAIGDFDHEFLDAPQADGIHLIEDLGVASSAKEQWFKPFKRPTDITHPFTWPNDKHYIFENWDHLK